MVNKAWLNTIGERRNFDECFEWLVRVDQENDQLRKEEKIFLVISFSTLKIGGIFTDSVCAYRFGDEHLYDDFYVEEHKLNKQVY